MTDEQRLLGLCNAVIKAANMLKPSPAKSVLLQALRAATSGKVFSDEVLLLVHPEIAELEKEEW